MDLKVCDGKSNLSCLQLEVSCQHFYRCVVVYGENENLGFFFAAIPGWPLGQFGTKAEWQLYIQLSVYIHERNPKLDKPAVTKYSD